MPPAPSPHEPEGYSRRLYSLLLPIAPSDNNQKLDAEDVRLVARWKQRRLYGINDLAIASEDTSIVDALRKMLKTVNGAYLCPYLTQYTAFDENLAPRIIATNYFKFVANVTTGKYDLDSLASVIIDEVEVFFDMFRPKHIDSSDLVFLRYEVTERLKAVRRGDIELSSEAEVKKIKCDPRGD